MSYSLQERSQIPLMNGNSNNGFSNWNSNLIGSNNSLNNMNPNNYPLNNNNNNINNNNNNNNNSRFINSNSSNNSNNIVNSINNPNNILGLGSIDTLDYRNKVIGTLPPQQSVQQVYTHQKLLQQQQQQIYLQKQKQYLLQQQQQLQQQYQNNDLGNTNNSSIGNNSQNNINQNNIISNGNKSIPQQFNNIDNDELIGRFKNLNSNIDNNNSFQRQQQQQVLLVSNNNSNSNLQQPKLYNSNNSLNINNSNNFVNNNSIYNQIDNNSNNNLNGTSAINNSNNINNINSSPSIGTMSPSIMGQLFSLSQLSLNGSGNNISNINNNSDFMNSFDLNFGIPSFQSQFFNPVLNSNNNNSNNLQQSIQQCNLQSLSPPQQQQQSMQVPQSPQTKHNSILMESNSQHASIPEPINISYSGNGISSTNKQISPQQQPQSLNSINKPPTPTLELNSNHDNSTLSSSTDSTNSVNNTGSNKNIAEYSNNFLDEANFPTLNSKDIRKSQNNNSLSSPQTSSVGSGAVDKKDDKKKKKLDSSQNSINSLSNSSEVFSEKIKLSWFEFQTLSSSISETDSEEPSRILWVGNIGMDVTEEELKDEFGSYGELESVRILHDRYCAFVNFKDTNNAINAKKHMHNQVIGSQYIVVNFRHPKASDDLTNANVPITTPETLNSLSRAIYIGNVSENLSEKDIRKECEKYGEIESIRILRKKACAFVNFMNVQNATQALQSLNGKKLGDSIVRVNYGKPQPPIEKSYK